MWELRNDEGELIDVVGQVSEAVERVERLEDTLHALLRSIQSKREEFNGL